MNNLIGKEKYFVHKGTWKNEYEWRIQKVKITGFKINKDGEEYVEFSFACCGYEYPVDWLKDTLEDAKTFAIQEIEKEKATQIEKIKLIEQ